MPIVRPLAGVRLLHRAREVARVDVRVDGRRLHGRVAEELLDVAHVGAALEQMRRAAVTQRVRRHAQLDTSSLRVRALVSVYRWGVAAPDLM